MKVIIAGSRHMPDSLFPLISKAVLSSGFDIEEIVSGTARGADRLGERWAREKQVPCKRFPANWDLYGKAAGHIRNSQMRDYADAAIVFIWDGSRGSANMILQMQKANKPVYVIKDGQLEL